MLEPRDEDYWAHEMEEPVPDAEASTDVVLPTGEQIDLSSAPQCAAALLEVRRLQEQLKDVAYAATGALLDEAARQGAKTITLAGMRVTVKGGDTHHWDVEILEELLDAGLPQERFNELVKEEVSYKVSKREADRIAAGRTEYAAIIERAKTVVPRAPYVTVERDPYA